MCLKTSLTKFVEAVGGKKIAWSKLNEAHSSRFSNQKKKSYSKAEFSVTSCGLDVFICGVNTSAGGHSGSACSRPWGMWRPADVGDNAPAVRRCLVGDHGEMCLVWDVGNVPCVTLELISVTVCVADVPSGSELCQRGGDEAFPQQPAWAHRAKTEENW